MRVKIAKWGNSLGLRLPSAAVEAADLTAGAQVDVTIEGRSLRVRAALPLKHYSLAELLAEMDRLGPENVPKTIDWGPDRGSEIIDDAHSRGEITPDDLLSGKRARKDAS